MLVSISSSPAVCGRKAIAFRCQSSFPGSVSRSLLMLACAQAQRTAPLGLGGARSGARLQHDVAEPTFALPPRRPQSGTVLPM
jgi:hypothetical protein